MEDNKNMKLNKRESINSKNEVDLVTFFRKFRSFWYVFIIGFLVGAIAGILDYSVISTPKYESTSMVYLRSSSKKLSLESLQLNTSLTQDYQIIFTSRPNLEAVINDLHLSYNVSKLKEMIKISNPNETRIIEVTVNSTNAREARNIANDIVDKGMDDIREIDSQEPFVVERAVINNNRVGFGIGKTAALSGLIGLIVAMALVIIKISGNDSFTSQDEVETSLEIPVLAVIAEDESLSYAKLESSNSRRRKHHGKKTSK